MYIDDSIKIEPPITNSVLKDHIDCEKYFSLYDL